VTVKAILRTAARRYRQTPALERPANVNDILTADEAHALAVAGRHPVALAEERLAGRVVTLLWRLGRVERFESGVVSAAVQEAQGVGKPVDDSEVQTLAGMRTFLARLEAAVQTLAGLAQLGDDTPLAPGVAFSAAESVFAGVPDDGGLPFFDSPGFLVLLGLDGETRFSEAPWTAGLLRQALGVVAKHLNVSVTCLTRRAARDAEGQRDDCRERVDALAAEVRSRQRRQRAAAGKRLSAALLPADSDAAKVERYEAHLGRQLLATLHELERIQARRAGRNVSLPGALDIGVSVSPAGDPAE
jgi:hypothetical protein